MTARPQQIGVGVGIGAVLLLVLIYLVAGGGSTPNGSTQISGGLAAEGIISASCASKQAVSVEPLGITAILIDRTDSVHSQTNAPNYVSIVDAEVRAAVDRGDDVVVSGFDGSAVTVHWTLVPSSFRGDANRKLLARADALTCLRTRLHEVSAEPAAAPGTDILGALQAARLPLLTAPAGARHLVIATDGIENTGCADLNTVAIGGSPASIASRCRKGHHLTELPGTQVTMLGLGVTGDGSANLPASTQLGWLTQVWASLCAAEVGATNCRITPGAPTELKAPASDQAAPDPSFTWPSVSQEAGHGVLILSLPDALLFKTDSSAVMPQARTALAVVAKEVRESSGTITKIVGHTDGTGKPARNELLSLARAQAIAQALVKDFGLHATTVTGVGSRKPKCMPEKLPDGSWNSAALQCNRRVEVVIRLSAGGT